MQPLSLKSRLIALVLGVGISSIAISSIVGWLEFRKAFRHQVLEHMTSVRAAKGKELETYFRGIRGHVASLSEDRMVVAAMVELNSAYRDLQNQTIDNRWLKAIERYYSEDFGTKLRQNVESIQIGVNFRPTTHAGQYLQYHYIVQNNASKPQDLDQAQDGSQYSTTHKKYHRLFRHITEAFGYEDLYLLDFNSGDVVYSVVKQSAFATNLDRGPHRRSNLSDVVAAVRNDPGRGFVQVVDYKPYVPAFSAPAAFMAAPIYNGPHIVGIVAIRLPTQRINAMLTGNQEWEKDGLGRTGQVYVVGADSLMRSNNRLLLEDPKKYEQKLKRLNLSPQSLNLVARLKTSILLHPIKTDATRAALSSAIATQVINPDQGVSVVSAYAPLRIQGLQWVILAEINESEAFQPISRLLIYVCILAVILILAIAWLANIAANRLFRPIQQLVEATKKALTLEHDPPPLAIDKNSPFGQLGNAFSELIRELQSQRAVIAEKTQTYDQLLENMLPASLIPRATQGDTPATETFTQVTVLVLKMAGLRRMMQTQNAVDLLEPFNALICFFENKAQAFGLESQMTLDDTYVATCGISNQFLDHQERTVKFALELVRYVEVNERDLPPGLDLQIGIHSGAVNAGILGTHKLMYKLWGNPITVAMALNRCGGAQNSILVTRPIYERLKNRYVLIPCPPVPVDEVGEVQTWLVFTQTSHFASQVEHIQQSYSQLLSRLPETAELFFQRLYQLEPTFPSLLDASDATHKTQCIEILRRIIREINHFDRLLPILNQWGQQSLALALEDRHYDAIADAFLWTLDQQLAPDDFSPEVQQSWRSIYHIIVGVLREASMGGDQPLDQPSDRGGSTV